MHQSPNQASTTTTSLSTRADGARCSCGRTLQAGTICWLCEQAAAKNAVLTKESEAILADLDANVHVVLDCLGLFPEHMDATMDRIHHAVRAKIPPAAVEAMRGGKKPEQGFGLIGTPGTGKSMALAALVRICMRSWVIANAPRMGRSVIAITPPVRWVDWPETVAWMRGNVERTDGRIERIVESPLLVLDDIGAERRVKQTYEEEFSAEKLDLILHGRRLRKLPTLWTSNLTEEALEDRYGSRTISRLKGSNPIGGWISGKDQRISVK